MHLWSKQNFQHHYSILKWWSFRNNCNIICCSRNISDYYCCFICVETVMHFSELIWYITMICSNVIMWQWFLEIYSCFLRSTHASDAFGKRSSIWTSTVSHASAANAVCDWLLLSFSICVCSDEQEKWVYPTQLFANIVFPHLEAYFRHRISW